MMGINSKVNLNSIEAATYQATIRTQFSLQKSILYYDELVANSIRLDDHKGYLLCVSELFAESAEIIALLAKWRSEATSYHDGFQVTYDSTKRWLRGLLLDVPDRILFLVLDPYGKPIGHLGFANSLNDQGLMEVDNVLRGVHNVEHGLMYLSMKALLAWATKTIKPNGFYLKTYEDNNHAIDFYQRLGFEISEKLPLRRTDTETGYKFAPIENDDQTPPDIHYVSMSYHALD